MIIRRKLAHAKCFFLVRLFDPTPAGDAIPDSHVANSWPGKLGEPSVNNGNCRQRPNVRGVLSERRTVKWKSQARGEIVLTLRFLPRNDLTRESTIMTQTLDIIQRLIAMDAALSFGGLAVTSFANKIHASVKTVHRDLYALRDLGQESYVRRNADGTYVRFYVKGVEPLFSCNRRRSKKPASKNS